MRGRVLGGLASAGLIALGLTSTAGAAPGPLGEVGQAPSVKAPGAQVAALATATSQTFVLPGGSYETRIYPAATDGPRDPAGPTPAPADSTTSTTTTPASALRRKRSALISSPGVTLDCDIGDHTPTSGSCSATDLKVGTATSVPETYRSLIRFDVSAIPSTAVVLNSELNLYNDQHRTTSGIQVDAKAVTRPWTSAVSWTNAAAGTPWTAAGGDTTATDATSVTGVGTANGWWEWYPTALTQKWVNGSVTNNGLELSTPTPATNQVGFASTESTTSAHRPYLDVYWTMRAGNRTTSTFDTQRLTDRSELGVDVSNGNLLVQAQDTHVSGTGIDLDMVRSYNSILNGVEWGWYGVAGQSSSSDPTVAVYGDLSASIATGDGATYKFQASGAHAWVPQTPGIQADLVDTSGGSYSSFALTFRGSGEKWTFNADGELVTRQDRNGNTITNTYDDDDPTSVTQITDTQGRDVTFTSDPDASYITDSTGRQFAYSFDGDGKLSDVEDPTSHTAHYGYDATTKLMTSITTPGGSVTKIAYDASKRVQSVMRTTNAGHTTGPTTTYAYSTGSPCATGETKTTVTDPNSHASIYCSDPTTGEVSKVQDPLGHSQTTTWTASGNVATYTAASNSVSGINTTNTYDATTDALTQIQQGTSASANLTTTFGYGSAQPYQPNSITDPNGRAKTLTYDTPGNLTSITDDTASPNTISSTLTYDPSHPGRITQSTDPNGHTVAYGYDTAGNLHTITPQAVTTGTRIGATTIDFDSLSRAHVITDGKTNTITVTYDNLDRITNQAYSSGTATGFVYDADGNLTSMTDTSGTTTYTYDALNRMLTRVNSGRTTTYTYDNASNLQTYTDIGGTTTYAYDNANHLTSATEPGSAVTSFTSNDDGARLTTTYPNSVVMTRVIDPAGRLTSLTTTKSTTTLASYTYTYSGSQRATMVDQAGNVTFYTYGSLGRLTRATTHAGSPTGTVTADYQYGYDKAGNFTTRTDLSGTVTYAYNENNELVTSTAGSWTHDADGQLTAGPGGFALAYNNRQQTTSITPAGGSANALTFADGNQQELTADGSATLQNSILGVSRSIIGANSTYYGRDNTGTLLSVRGTATSYPLYDGQGNISALTNTSGTITDTYTYDPYGRQTHPTGSSAQPFGYNAGYTTNGLIHYGARIYNPATGRWTQQDPLNQAADLSQGNRYTYAGDDPVNLSDASGLCLDPPGLGGTPGQGTVPCDGTRPGSPPTGPDLLGQIVGTVLCVQVKLASVGLINPGC
jgi:RHS repeat-associated protein